MKKGTSTGPTICSVCKRKKEAAIREQVHLGCNCGTAKCTYDQEIKSALKQNKQINILTPIKPALKIRILPPLKPNPDEIVMFGLNQQPKMKV